MQVILVQEHYRSIMIHKINQNNQNNKKLLMYYYILYNKMLFSKKTLFEYQELFFDIFISVSYILIFLYIFGISKTAKTHLDTIDKYIKIYICLFLIYRFNPFRTKYEFTNLDRKIAFSSGLFMFTTSVFGIIFF